MRRPRDTVLRRRAERFVRDARDFFTVSAPYAGMRGSGLCCCVLAACASEPATTETPPEVTPDGVVVGNGTSIEPDSPHVVGECAYQVSLYGMTAMGPTPIGPVT